MDAIIAGLRIAPACTALVYVDDATSRLIVVLFVGVESTFAYFEATHQYLKRYGKPLALYSVKASVFRVNKQSAAAGKGHTQFGRALYELNIDGICANTPAAKGRVERVRTGLVYYEASATQAERVRLESKLQGALETIRSRTSSSLGWKNQLAHAEVRLTGVQKLLATAPGAQPFPDGPDLSKPTPSGVLDD
jgi:hypothetical protein